MNPTQLFALWMEETHQFHALGDYVRSLKGKPDGAYPLVRLPAQIRTAVYHEMKGQAQDAVKQAAATAERDVVLLFHLFMNVNKNVLEERQANWLHLALLTMLSPAQEHETPMFGRRPWGEAASAFLLDVYATVGAVDYVSKRYFGGRSPLFFAGCG